MTFPRCKVEDCPGADVCLERGPRDVDCEYVEQPQELPTQGRGKPVYKVFVIGEYAFVPHPLARGLWLRTDLSVAKVACPFEGCESPIGVPCKSMRFRGDPKAMVPTRYTSSTHWRRRQIARAVKLPGNITTIEFKP